METKFTSKEFYEGVKKMNDFGVRLTGSKPHTDFINYLKQEITDMGLTVYSDPFCFDRWEEEKSSLSIIDGDSEIPVEISSVYPYSGQTDEEGIREEMVYVSSPKDLLSIAGKIAVYKVKNVNFIPSEIAFDKRSAYPEDVTLEKKYEGPVITSFVQFFQGMLSKLAKAKAVILIWEGMSDECVKGQYLSFIMSYQNIPMVWLSETQGEKVIAEAKKGKKAHLVLTAKQEKNAFTETFYCMLKGKNTKENVIINTHTDGTNCIEENGPIALLGLIKELKDRELNRTHIFVFTTGHFRLPKFKDIRTGAFQATSRWLAMHRHLWDGKEGHYKCVANLTLEHMGCLEWRDQEGGYLPTGEIDTELVYTGNKAMDDIYLGALEGRERVRTMTLRGHNALHFGEGQNFFTMGIPEISLVPAPYFLCVVSESHEMEKFDAELMYDQTVTYLKIINKIEELPSAYLGRSDSYSILKAKSVSGGYDLSLKGLLERIKASK